MLSRLKYNITGHTTEIVEVILEPGEGIHAETGSMVFMTDGITMRTNLGGGLLKGIKRKLAGEHFFISTFENTGNERAVVGVGAYYPGKIVAIDLGQYEGKLYSQQRCFLCAEKSVEVSIGFTKRLGAGLFGGEGFILQKLYGEGMAFLHAGGSIIRKELLAGETLRVDTGCLLAFSSSIDYDITFVTGVMNPLFGGEGLIMARLTGPGEVLMQSLPFSRLADNIHSAITKSGEGGKYQ